MTSGNCDLTVAIFKGQHSPSLLVTVKCRPSKLSAQLVFASLPHKEAFKEFLSSMAELINSYLKPDVKSKWVKICLIMVPNAFLESLLLSMGLTKPFSAREALHPPPLKMELWTALYYNVYHISVLTNVFAAILPLKTKAYFRCNQEVRAPQSKSNLTTQEKIALVRQRAGSTVSEKPTSRR